MDARRRGRGTWRPVVVVAVLGVALLFGIARSTRDAEQGAGSAGHGVPPDAGSWTGGGDVGAPAGGGDVEGDGAGGAGGAEWDEPIGGAGGVGGSGDGAGAGAGAPRTDTEGDDPASTAEAYERLLREQLEPGLIAYSSPGRMEVGDRVTVTARITRDDLDAVSDDIRVGLDQAGGAIEMEEIEVGTSMRTTLEGDAFTVKRIGPERQMLRQTGHRQWQWRVEALRSGTWPLYLTVYVSHEGQDIDNVTLSREITVTVDPVRAVTGFWSGNWQWLLSTVVASGAVAGGAKRRHAARRTRADGPPVDERPVPVETPPPRRERSSSTDLRV